MHFYKPVVISQLLEISADRILRHFQLLTEVGRMHLVVEVDPV